MRERHTGSLAGMVDAGQVEGVRQLLRVVVLLDSLTLRVETREFEHLGRC